MGHDLVFEFWVKYWQNSKYKIGIHNKL